MDVQQFAADTLLERGLPLPVRASLFLRWMGYKNLKCYQPSVGNLIRINRLYLKMGIKAEQLEEISLNDAFNLTAKHGTTLCQIIAMGMFRGWLTPLLFSYPMAIWLKYNIKPKRMCEVAYIMLAYNGTSDFMNTTRCIEESLILKKQLGQTPKMS